MRALIVGGGIAGPAAALALTKAGIEAVVFERRPESLSEEGSYFTVAPNGLDALAAIDALDLVRDAGFPSRFNAMYGATGSRLGEVSIGSPLADGTPGISMKRSRMSALLGDEAERRGVQFRRDARVIGVTEDEEQATVELEGGERVTGDLIVGADGVHSMVRRAIDASAPGARYVGLSNFGGITRGTPLARQLEPEAWHFVFGARAFAGAHPTPNGDVVWFVNVPEPEISRERRQTTSREEWRAILIQLVEDDAGPLAALIRAGELELAGDNTYDLPHVPTWASERMILIGDAAHAPSPSSGQGASLALEDAVVLAQALRDEDSVPRAFASFERARRTRAEKIVAVGARSSSSKIPGPTGRRIQELILRFVFRVAVTDRSTAWISGHRLRWESPVLRP